MRRGAKVCSASGLQEPYEQPDARQLQLLCGSRDRHIYACMDDYIVSAFSSASTSVLVVLCRGKQPLLD